MTTPVIVEGSSLHNSPELLVRQILMEGLPELAGDRPRVAQLFKREDRLRQGSQAQFEKDAAKVLQSLCSAEAGGWHVGEGYPPDHINLPWISVVPDSSSEQTSSATMGDVLQQKYERIDEGQPTERHIRHLVQGAEQSTSIQVGCWSNSPEGAAILWVIVKHLLFFEKGRLSKVGIMDISSSESGFAPDDDMQKRTGTGYVPLIKLSVDWTMRYTRRTQVPFRINLSRGAPFN